MKQLIFNTLIIGAGDIGAGYDTPDSINYLTHAHAFSDHKGFNLVGFVDPNRPVGEAAALKWLTSYFSTIEEAFSKNKIDVVIVATPDEHHFSVLKEIASYKPMFVLAEKPITKTIEEAAEIISIYKQNNIPAIVNYKRRFVPEIINLKRKLEGNLFGEFVFGVSYYGKGFLHNGSHTIDLLLYLLENEWIKTEIIEKIIDFESNDPSYSIILKDSDDKKFLIKALNSNDFGIFEFDLVFSKGRIRITELGFKIEEYTVKQNKVFLTHQSLEVESTKKTKLNNSLFFTVDHIYKYLNGSGFLLCALDESFKSMKFMNKIITGN